MDRVEELMNSGKVIKIARGEVTVTALSVNDLTDLCKSMGEELSKLMEIAANLPKGQSPLSVSFVLACLDVVPKLFLLLDRAAGKDEGFCKTLPLVDISELVVVILELNDIPRILRNFYRAKSLVMIPTNSEK